MKSFYGTKGIAKDIAFLSQNRGDAEHNMPPNSITGA